MKEKLESVAILLSAYNGELFIAEQIESIIKQSYTNWRLYIRDDGSTDDTLRIIEKYCKLDSRITLIIDSNEHRGPKNSFLWLLEQINSDYYMFCDQDDVWNENKILYSYNATKEIPKERPALIVTDLVLVDQNIRTLKPSMWRTHKLTKLVFNKDGLLIAPMFPGCTMFFNKIVRDLVIKENFDFPMHDMKVSFVTKRNNGLIIPVTVPLIYYRQHSNNVIGLYSGSNILLHKLKKIAKTYNENVDYYGFVNKYFKISAFKYIRLKVQHFLGII